MGISKIQLFRIKSVFCPKVIFCIILFSIYSSASTISGRVTDKATNNPIDQATIILQETSDTTMTNNMGEFTLNHNYTVSLQREPEINNGLMFKNITLTHAGPMITFPVPFELFDTRGLGIKSHSSGLANHFCPVPKNGVYFLRFRANNTIYRRKVVITEDRISPVNFKSDGINIESDTPILPKQTQSTVTLTVSKSGYYDKVVNSVGVNATGLEIQLSQAAVVEQKLWPLWDPGFEESSSFGAWFEEDPSGVVSTTRTSDPQPHDGERLLKITGSDGYEYQYMYKMAAGRRYEVKAWVYNHGKIGIKDLGSDEVYETENSAPSNSWKQISVQFVSTGSPAYCYAKYGNSSGASMFDKFEVSDISTDIDLSATPPVPIMRYASQVIDVSRWKITLPINDAEEVYTPALYTLDLDPWFKLVQDADGYAVQFRANHGGSTTSGSKNPRSEFRELTENHHFKNSKSTAEWSNTDGLTHEMWIKQKVVRLTSVKPHLVTGQIHDSGDDVCVFRLEGHKTGTPGVVNTHGNLWITKDNDTHGYLVDPNYELGTVFTVKFIAYDGKVEFEYNGEKVPYVHTQDISGCYFKLGNYTQSNDETAPNESEDAYAETYVYDYYVKHE